MDEDLCYEQKDICAVRGIIVKALLWRILFRDFENCEDFLCSDKLYARFLLDWHYVEANQFKNK